MKKLAPSASKHVQVLSESGQSSKLPPYSVERGSSWEWFIPSSGKNCSWKTLVSFSLKNIEEGWLNGSLAYREEIFPYVYPKSLTGTSIWNSSSWRFTSRIGVVWKTALWHGTKPWAWRVRQADFQGRRFYPCICHCPCLSSAVHPKYSWSTVQVKIVRATRGAPWVDISELRRISWAQLCRGSGNVRFIVCIQQGGFISMKLSYLNIRWLDLI